MSGCQLRGEGETGRPALLIYSLLVLLALRALFFALIYKWDLFVGHDEELARYWLPRDIFNLRPLGEEFSERSFTFIEVTPWLPLQLLSFHVLHKLGSLHLFGILLFQNLATWLTSVCVTFLAWRLAGRDWRAGALAAGLFFLSPLFQRISSGFLSEPLYFLSLAALVTGAVFYSADRSRIGLAVFWAGVFIGHTNRYETWTFSALLLLVIFWSDWRRERLSLRFALLSCAAFAAFPLFWLSLQWYVTGSPVGFLSLTREHFAINVSAETRWQIVERMLASIPIPASIAFGLTIVGLFLPCTRSQTRIVAAAALFQGVQVIVLTLRGEGAFAYIDRLMLAPFVLAIPAAVAVAWNLLARSKWQSGLSALSIAGAALMVAIGIWGLASSSSHLRRHHSYGELRELRAALASRAPGDEPYLFVDPHRGDWSLIAIHTIAHDRWRIQSPTPEEINTGLADYPHALLLRPENYPEHAPEPWVRTEQWVILVYE